MDFERDRETLKRRAIAALDEARMELGAELHRARFDYSPRTLLAQSLKEHRVWWMTAAAVGGFVVVQWLFNWRSSANGRDISGGTARKRTWSALLFTSLWSLARKPVMDFATQHLQNYIGAHVAGQFPQPNQENSP